jgi:hypothetical protein
MSDEEIVLTFKKPKISRAKKAPKRGKKIQNAVNVFTTFPTCRYSGKGLSRKLCNFSHPIQQNGTFFDVLSFNCIWMIFDFCDLHSLVLLKRSCTFFSGAANSQFTFSNDLSKYTGFLTAIETYIVQTYLKNVYTQHLVLTPSSLPVYKQQTMRFKVGEKMKPSISEPFYTADNLSPIDKLRQLDDGKVVVLPNTGGVAGLSLASGNSGSNSLCLNLHETYSIKEKHFSDLHSYSGCWDVYTRDTSGGTLFSVCDYAQYSGNQRYLFARGCEISLVNSAGVVTGTFTFGTGMMRLQTPLTEYDFTSLNKNHELKLNDNLGGTISNILHISGPPTVRAIKKMWDVMYNDSSDEGSIAKSTDSFPERVSRGVDAFNKLIGETYGRTVNVSFGSICELFGQRNHLAEARHPSSLYINEDYILVGTQYGELNVLRRNILSSNVCGRCIWGAWWGQKNPQWSSSYLDVNIPDIDYASLPGFIIHTCTQSTCYKQYLQRLVVFKSDGYDESITRDRIWSTHHTGGCSYVHFLTTITSIQALGNNIYVTNATGSIARLEFNDGHLTLKVVNSTFPRGSRSVSDLQNYLYVTSHCLYLRTKTRLLKLHPVHLNVVTEFDFDAWKINWTKDADRFSNPFSEEIKTEGWGKHISDRITDGGSNPDGFSFKPASCMCAVNNRLLAVGRKSDLCPVYIINEKMKVVGVLPAGAPVQTMCFDGNTNMLYVSFLHNPYHGQWGYSPSLKLMAKHFKVEIPPEHYENKLLSNLHNCIVGIDLSPLITNDSVILNIGTVIPCRNGVITRKHYLPMSPYYMEISGQFLHCGCYGRLVVRMKSPPPSSLIVRRPSTSVFPLASKQYSRGFNFPHLRGTDEHMFEHPNLFLGDVVSIGWPASYGLHQKGIVISPGIVFTWQRDCRFCTNAFFKRQLELSASNAECPFVRRHNTNMIGCSIRGILTNIPAAVPDGDKIVPLNIEILSRGWVLLRTASSMFATHHKPSITIPRVYPNASEEKIYRKELAKWKEIVVMCGRGTSVHVKRDGVITLSSDIDMAIQSTAAVHNVAVELN